MFKFWKETAAIAFGVFLASISWDVGVKVFAQQAPPAPVAAVSVVPPVFVPPYNGASGSTQTPLAAFSGAQAAATVTATLTGAAGKFTYLSHFDMTATGATAGTCVGASVTGLAGGTMAFLFCTPTGNTLGATPLVMNFNPPLQSAAVNTNVVVTLPSLGAGNNGQSVNAEGFLQ